MVADVGANSKSFRWLHFSDIHVGQDGQDRVWPRASTVLLDDLEIAHGKTGGFDCLIFSGDLVQTGSACEFEEFDHVLVKILDRLGELGEWPPSHYRSWQSRPVPMLARQGADFDCYGIAAPARYTR